MQLVHSVCRKCGCGAGNLYSALHKYNHEHCFGCGTGFFSYCNFDEYGNPILDEKSEEIINTKKGYGTCLTKDYEMITFIQKPSLERVKELEKEAISLVLWNDDENCLDVIVGEPLTKEDVIRFDENRIIKKYMTEPKIGGSIK